MIALGTRVVFSHEAYVIRKRNEKWYIPVKGNLGGVPVGCVQPSDAQREDGVVLRVPFGPPGKVYWEMRHLVEPNQGAGGRINKSIGVIPSTGSGVVIDRVKRQVGISHGPRYDIDGGYFESLGHAYLYVVKSAYGVPPTYVPEDSITPEVLA